MSLINLVADCGREMVQSETRQLWDRIPLLNAPHAGRKGKHQEEDEAACPTHRFFYSLRATESLLIVIARPRLSLSSSRSPFLPRCVDSHKGAAKLNQA